MADSYTLMFSASQGFFAEKSSDTQDEGFCILPTLPETTMAANDSPIDALSVYVREVMKANGLTVYAVERQARKRGGKLGKSTVDGIIQGSIKNPGIYTLRELAWGLGKPIEEVVAVTLGTPLTESTGYRKSDFANLWDLYRQLDKASDRHFFDRVFDMAEKELRRLLSGD